MKMMKYLIPIPLLIILSSCAQLHHVQIGEIVSHPNYVQKPFEVKISETGFDIGEAIEISKTFMNKQDQQGADNISSIIALFQMGPRTGKPVYVKGYAKNLIQVIYEKCPTGKITGLMSIRESREYPVISGEIVKVTGYCLIKKDGV
jgi:hypothetical protein